MWRPWKVLDGESTEDDSDSKEKRVGEEEEGRLVGVGDDEGTGWTRGDRGGYLKCWRQQPIRGNYHFGASGSHKPARPEEAGFRFSFSALVFRRHE
jgi:hypothetical protein